MKLEFKVLNIQTALFIKSLDIRGVNKTKIPTEINETTDSLFDGETAILPLPPDAPPEIPRIILKSEDEIYTCNIAQNRVDFFFNEKEAVLKSLEDIIDVYLDHEKKINSYFKEQQNISINRIGFIVKLVAGLDKNANKYLRDAFIRNGLLEDPYELSFRYLKRDKIDKLDVNVLINLSVLKLKDDFENDRNLLLQIDINTIPERVEEYNLSIDDKNKFIEEALKRIKLVRDNFPKFKIR